MPQHPKLTWGQVKAWAADNKVPDDAQMAFLRLEGSLSYIRDLDQYDADEDRPGDKAEFILQEKWG